MKIKFLRLFVTAVALLSFPIMNFGQAPNLGKASSFALFSSVGAFTSNGATTVTGDIGNYSGAVNSTPATLNGNKHFGDSTAFYAATAVGTAYASLKAMTCGGVLGTTMGSGQTVNPGVYCTGAATTLGGTLTLDAGGNANAIFVFQINGAFASGSQSKIILKNSASACNVYWQINGAVALGDSSVFQGTIVADGAITTGATTILNGRGLTTAGAITLNASTITMGCSSPIVITTQPSPQTACAGNSTSFSVSATGTGLTYQWRNGSTNINNGAHISGATTATLTINPVATTDAATKYNVIISSTVAANDTSTNASLVVNSVTAATVASQTVCSGTSAVFTVSATSTGTATISYQWQLSANGGTSFSNISGATASSYTVTTPAGSLDNNQYRALVSSGSCSSFTSTSGTLRVNGVSAATVASQAVCSGNNAVFTVSPTYSGPAGLTYQWMVSTNGGTSFANISGATASSYTVTAPGSSSDNYQYENVVTSSGCGSLTSTAGTLRVNAVTAATVANQTACSATNAIFAVSVTSTGSAALSYQWLLSTNGGTSFSTISGATSSSYAVAVSASFDNYQYEAVVTSGSCTSFTSNAATLRVNAVTSASVAGQTVCSGNDATFSVATSNTGPAALGYQWKQSTNGGSSFTSITGATSASYTESAVPASADNYQFECVVTSGSCTSYVSTAGVLRVNAVTSATVAGQVVCSGIDATFTVSTTSTGTATLSYQWERSTDNGTSFANISGATSSSYTESGPSASFDNYLYECIVISGNCTAFTSTVATLRVNEITSATVAGQTVCSGNDATFSVAVTNSGSAAISYQWQISTNGGNTFTSISGATASAYTVSAPGPFSDNYEYNCIVASGNCASVTSTTGILRVNSVTSALIAGQVVCTGTDATFSVLTISTGSGLLSYQWKLSTDGGLTFSNIPGATSVSYVVAAPDASFDNNVYECVVASASCDAFTSNQTSLRVNSANAAPVLGQTVCSGTDAIFNVYPTSSGPASLTYQWQLSTNGGSTFANISGANDTIYTVSAPDGSSDNYQYRNVITSGTCASYTSTAGVLRVNEVTAATVASQSVCSENDATFTVVTANTGSGVLTYQWKRSTDNGKTFSDIPGATAATFVVSAPTPTSDGYQYESVVTSASCSAITSSIGTLNINIAPNITGGLENACVCRYTDASLSVDATGTALTYQWRRGNVNLVDSGKISGANTSVLTVTSVDVTDTASNYNVIVMGTCSPNDTSKNVSITLCQQSLIELAKGNVKNDISIFPNPFSSSISIRITGAKTMNDFQLRITNALGVEVINTTITQETTTLNTGSLPAGVYFYSVTGNDQIIQTGKIVSEK